MIKARYGLILHPLFWFSMAVVLRLSLGLARLDAPINDQDNYIPFAKALIQGEGMSFEGQPTAYRPPLYPMVLAPLYGLFGDGKAFHASFIVLQSLMGGLTVWLVMRSVQIILQAGDNNAGLAQQASFQSALAGCLTACDPVLMSQSSLPMTETLAALLLAYAAFLLIQGQSFSSGILFGLSALCRPSLLACTALVMFARLLSFTDGKTILMRVRESALILTGTVVVLLPWGLRNWLVLGDPVFTTTHGGYTFALANNPVYYEEVLNGPPGSVWSGQQQKQWMDEIGPSLAGLSEAEAAREMSRRTWKFVFQNPRDFLRSCLARQLHFWSIMPSGQVYGWKIRIITAIWTTPFWILSLISLFRKASWAWPLVAYFAVIVGLASVHLIYWTDMRMRAPIVPALSVLASGSVVFFQFFRKLSQHRS